jgi:RHS repeat-associated protein
LVQDSVTMRVDFTYDQFGRVLTQKRYSDSAGTELVATTKFTYDAYGNPASIVNTDADNATIDEFDYTFDAGGNLTSETDFQGGISEDPWTNDYTFDAQNQLTGDGTNSYDYDLGGNRDTGYTYVPNPDMVHYTNEVASDGVWNYTYDANGNTIKKVAISGGGTWVYGYDNANQLILAQQWSADPDVHEDAEVELSVTYKYNAFGEKIEEDVGGTAYRKFVIDGWNPDLPTPVGNENQEVLAQLDVSNSETVRYLHGDQVDQEFGRIDFSPATPSWTLTDHLSSVRDVINNDANINDSIVYDSFGNIANESNSAYRGWYGWTGRELDTEINLQYNHARWYDSSNGRWISQDPMGFDAGDSNLYRYVNNRPLNSLDNSGCQTTVERASVGELMDDLVAREGKDSAADYAKRISEDSNGKVKLEDVESRKSLNISAARP